jgi:allophanate hydrolase subunit 1
MTGVDMSDLEQQIREKQWSAAAESLLEEALSEVRDGVEAISTVTAALDVLRVEAGELPEETVECLGEEEAQRPCSCPEELLARGAHRGNCPAHAPTI